MTSMNALGRVRGEIESIRVIHADGSWDLYNGNGVWVRSSRYGTKLSRWFWEIVKRFLKRKEA